MSYSDRHDVDARAAREALHRLMDANTKLRRWDWQFVCLCAALIAGAALMVFLR